MAKQKFRPNMPPHLMKLYEQMVNGGGLGADPLYQGGKSHLQGILNNEPGSFEAFEAPYKRRFEQETVPGLANQFASYGTGAGGLKGSGFYGALSSAGAGLEQDLASMRENLKMQAAQMAPGYAKGPMDQLMEWLQMNPYDVEQEQQPWWQGAAEGAVQGAATAFGGPIGTAASGAVIGGAKNLMNRPQHRQFNG
jgi:hypothetical protein